MFKFVRSRSLSASLVCLSAFAGVFFAAATAHAQSATPEHRQLDRMDLALTGPLEITKRSSGGGISQDASTASGVLATFRYTKSPLLGAEMNYKRSRLTENYVYPFTTQSPGGGATVTPTPFGVQSDVIETSWGYVAHTPSAYLGIKPFGGVGVGSLEFKPTPNGGQGLIRQFRAMYYWHVGGDYTFPNSHFGVRVQVRQLFYLAPDFGENYLTSGARTNTIEPAIGFFAHF